MQARYREAFFRFDILQAQAAWRKNERVCLFSNQWGENVGASFVSTFDDKKIVFECALTRTTHVPPFHDAIAFFLEPSPCRVTPDRVNFLCPRCKSRRIVMIYNGQWGCSHCLRLHGRRQLVDAETLKWERLRDLSKMIEAGRPHWMRHEKYADFGRELKGLERELRGKSERFCSSHHARRIDASWHNAEDVRDVFTSYEGFHVEDDRPVRRLIVDMRAPPPAQRTGEIPRKLHFDFGEGDL